MMSATLINLIIQLIAGAVGGNAAGATMRNIELGTLGNTIAGAIGGAGGGTLLTALLPTPQGAAGNVDIGAMLGQAVGGGVAGARATLSPARGIPKSWRSARPASTITMTTRRARRRSAAFAATLRRRAKPDCRWSSIRAMPTTTWRGSSKRKQGRAPSPPCCIVLPAVPTSPAARLRLGNPMVSGHFPRTARGRARDIASSHYCMGHGSRLASRPEQLAGRRC